jgi:2,5-diketo-D-gluconate reductase B
MKTINGIPQLGFGTYPLKGNEAYNAVRMAIDLGYRHIDTAQMYVNEAEVGRAIKDCGISRSEFFIVTKVNPYHLGEDLFASSTQKSLENLGGPVDLLLIHWPPQDSDINPTLDRLMAEKQKGSTQNIGISNFNVSMMRNAVKHTNGQIMCNQVEFHPLIDQTLVLVAAHELGVVIEAYSPIARGKALLPDVIVKIAARLQRPAAEIVLRWIVQKNVVPIPMTTKKNNAASNLKALEFELSDADMSSISALGSSAGRMVNTDWMRGRWDN